MYASVPEMTCGGDWGRLALVPHARRKPEPGEPNPTGHDVREHVRGLEVPVNQVTLMKPSEGYGQPDRHAQKHAHVPWGPQVTRQEAAAGVLDRQPTRGGDELEGACGPGGVQLIAEAVRVLEFLQRRSRRSAERWRDHEPRRADGRCGVSREDEFPLVPEDFRLVRQRRHHPRGDMGPH
jgi:hypothetical protein